MSRAKPASAESLPGGTEANSIASAAPAAKTATTASSRSGLFCREGEVRSLRGVGSIRIFYSLNRGDGTPRYSCGPNFLELRQGEVRLSPGPMDLDFSGSCPVTSRNPLIHKGATTATKSLRPGATGGRQGLLSRAWRCVEEPLATANFAEFIFPRLSENSSKTPKLIPRAAKS